MNFQALEQEVVKGLEAAGMETKVVKRYQYNDEVVKWADLIVTTGVLDDCGLNILFFV